MTRDRQMTYKKHEDDGQYIWVCTGCGERDLPWNIVTFEETHDARYGGCGALVVAERALTDGP